MTNSRRTIIFGATTNHPPLITLIGPTAVGKTALSFDLANAVDGEIISADSRLFYRGMDIGTAKPTPAELRRIPHHLVDIVNPGQVISLAEYQQRAFAVIKDITDRGKVPLLVGGSGQYIRAIVEGWGIPRVPPSPSLRAELEALAADKGPGALHERLRELDPVAADRIDYRNVRRVIRALEVTLIAGRPISEIQRKSPPPYSVLQIGLVRPREILFDRVDRRIDQMLLDGLVQEVQGLLDAGHDLALPAMSALGYRQIGRHLLGEISLDEAIRLLRKETRRFLRQQGTWFRQDDPLIRWYDLEKVPSEQICAFEKDWLKEHAKFAR